MGEAPDEADRIAEAVSDRTPVDWPRAHLTQPHLRSLLDRLRDIEAVAEAHQKPLGRRSPSRPAAQGPPARAGSTGSGSSGVSASRDSVLPERIGHYGIHGLLGRGGMGVVYRAYDGRLQRPVAIKALPDALADDSEAMLRFEREAKLLASLNHPNIATVYGLETEGGRTHLVMECVEGESLASRLSRGPLEVQSALRFCTQVAAAFEAAHERGVVHRDLKPGNVMIGPRGTAKVLDFGLAKRVPQAPAAAGSDLATTFRTDDRVRLGTPGYMSPEQVIGLPQDWRTDVFAFGCLLYECLAGRRTFRGEDASVAMAAALGAEPDWAALPAETPREVRVLLRRCLQKDAARRGPMADARRELEGALLRVERRGAYTTPLEVGRAGGRLQNMPCEATSFVGREREIAECMALLENERLLTLTGIGGSGKTRLAIQVAAETVVEKPDGVWFVDLAPIPDGGRVAAAVAEVFDIREVPGTSLHETLVTELKERRALLVLDNCDLLRPACAELAQTLLRGTAVQILATSREALDAAGERTYPVPPLTVPPKGVSDATAMQFESVELFLERARRVAPALSLDAPQLAAVADICRRLDGIPLAIELAAARTLVLSFEEIGARLDERFRLLSSASGAWPARQQRLEAVIAWSYEQLAEREQKLFRSLSVFAEGATLEAVGAVCAPEADDLDLIEPLSQLVERSLLTVERPAEGESRYRMLETVRDFSHARLVEAGERSRARDRHLTYFSKRVTAAFPHLSGPEESKWVARLSRDHANILAALRWCDEAPDGAELGLRMTQMLGRFWYIRGDLTLGEAEAARALARPGADGATSERAGSLYTAGDLAAFRGQHDLAQRYLLEALGIHGTLGDTMGKVRCLIGLGNVAAEQSDYPHARELYLDALALARTLDQRRPVAIVLGNLGEIASRQKDLDGARTFNEEALALLREGFDQHALAMVSASQASVLLRLDLPGPARERLLEGVRLFQVLGARRGAVYGALAAARLAALCADWTAATRFLAGVEMLRTSSAMDLAASDQAEFDSIAVEARAALREAEFQQTWTSSQSSSFESLLDDILSWLEGRDSPASRT